MILQKIDQLEKQIKEAETEKISLEARIKLLQEQLASEFKANTIEEAKELLSDMEKEIKGLEEVFQDEFKRLETEVAPFLNGR